MNNTSHQRGNHNIRFGASAQRVYVENFDSAGTVPGFGLGVSLDSPYALTTRFFPGGVSGDDLFGAGKLARRPWRASCRSGLRHSTFHRERRVLFPALNCGGIFA